LASIAAAYNATNDKLDALVGTISDLVDVQEGSLETPCEDRIDRFVDNRDGTVTDSFTGLMWQQSFEWGAAHVESGSEFRQQRDNRRIR